MATAKAAVRETRKEWERHALALAVERHLTGTARLEYDGDLGRHYTVPNADRRGAGHWVSISRDGHTLVCECVAGIYRKPCSHVGAVLHAERMRALALATDARREWISSWLKGWEW